MDNKLETNIANFCEIVDDAAHWCRKNNKFFPVRKKFFASKPSLAFYLYRNFKIVHCEELIQKNKDIEDRTPFVLVKMVFEIDGRNFTFHTPKKNVWWEYEHVSTYKEVEIFSKRPSSFSPKQIFEICGVMTSLGKLARFSMGNRTSHMEQVMSRIESFSNDWRSSDKLREINNKTGLFL